VTPDGADTQSRHLSDFVDREPPEP
jgi:hypothetical protein